MKNLRVCSLGMGVAVICWMAVVRGPMVQSTHAAEVSAAQQAQIDSLVALSNAFQGVADRVRPSVVHVLVKASRTAPAVMGQDPREELFRRFFGPDAGRDPFSRRFRERDPRQQDPDQNPEQNFDAPQVIGSGSGWVFDADGHVVTNSHVIRNAESITLKFADKVEREAEVVGSDPKTDIAVLKVKGGLPESARAARLSNEAVAQGQIVFAFGSPFQYEFSVSQGIVSGFGRRTGILGQGGYESFIQTDAAINPGNSGGPLTNVRGEVVGMNSAIATTSGSFAGLGFAIPTPMAKPIIEQLIGSGKVTRGYLGAWISDEKKLLKSFGAEHGVVIQDVIDGGPAKESGLEAGDVVIELEGNPTTSADQLRNRVAATAPGEVIKLKILRAGKEKNVDVKLKALDDGAVAAAQPAEKEASKGIKTLVKLGFEDVRTLDKPLARESEIEFHPGVLVTEVRPGSVAAAAGIVPGTLIVRVMDRDVKSTTDLVREMERHDLKKGVRLRVMGPDGRAAFVVLTLDD